MRCETRWIRQRSAGRVTRRAQEEERSRKNHLEAPDDESDLFRSDFGVLSVRVLEKGESGRSVAGTP